MSSDMFYSKDHLRSPAPCFLGDLLKISKCALLFKESHQHGAGWNGREGGESTHVCKLLPGNRGGNLKTEAKGT